MKDSLFLISLDKLFRKGMTLEQAIIFAAEKGFKAVEFFPLEKFARPDMKAARDIAKLCGDLGLEMSCFSVMADLTVSNYPDTVQMLKRYIEMAGSMGISLFHHTLAPELRYGRRTLPVYRDIKNRILDLCEEICEYAAQFGITCVYEEQGLVFNGSRNFGDFYHSLRAGNKGIVADIGNILFVGEDPADFISENAADIIHVHVKDYLWKKGGLACGRGWYISKNCDALRGTVIGHGIIDFVKIFKVLGSAGYQGYFSIEFDGMEDPKEAVILGRENMFFYMDEAQAQLKNMI